MTLEVNINSDRFGALHDALVKQEREELTRSSASRDPANERARKWQESERAERRRAREANRALWVQYYRALELSFAAQSERCGEKARLLEEVNRNGQHDTKSPG